MKNSLLIIIVGTVVCLPTYAANYNSFIAPSSLGKDVNTLNKQYKLGLSKQDWNGYSNSDSDACKLDVGVTKTGKINFITIMNTENCQYSTQSNVTYNSKNTETRNLLSQVDIENVQFIPGCFNCPSRIEITDELMINRAEDSYYTKFEIQGYNKAYIDYIAKKLFGSTLDDYYSMMDMLELRAAQDENFYDRNAFKLQAIKTYKLQDKPLSYTIALK